MSEIVWYLSFCVCLISLDIMVLTKDIACPVCCKALDFLISTARKEEEEEEKENEEEEKEEENEEEEVLSYPYCCK